MFELDDGKTAAFELCDSRGNIGGKIKIIRLKDEISAATQDLKKPWALCLRNIHGYSQITGADAKDGKEGLILTVSGDTEHITVRL